MARPKDRSSSAFLHKCAAEREKLQKSLAEHLKQDLLRLLSEELHSDVVIQAGRREFPAHKFVLKARCKHLLDKLYSVSATSEDAVISLDHVEPSVLGSFLRQMYTTEHANDAAEEFEYYLDKVVKGDGGSREKDLENLPLNCDGHMTGELSLDDNGHMTNEGLSLVTNGHMTLSEDGKAICDRDFCLQNVDVNVDSQNSMCLHKSVQESVSIPSSDTSEQCFNEISSLSSTVVSGTKSALLIGPRDNETECTENLSKESNSHSPLPDVVMDSILPHTSSITDSQTAANVQPTSSCVENMGSGDMHSEPVGGSKVDKNSSEQIHPLVPVCSDVYATKTTDTPAKLSQSNSRNQMSNQDDSGVTGGTNSHVYMYIPNSESDSVEISFKSGAKSASESGQKLNKKKSSKVHTSAQQVQTKDKTSTDVGVSGTRELPQDVSLSDMIKLSYNLSVPYDVCSRLGEDLLRAFLQEVDCDCTLVVCGQTFLAHRCILAARSSYFCAMLSGPWMESDAQNIVLEGITPGVMEQTLLYLYGGVCTVDESCTLGELIMMADMYGMEGLKEVVLFNLKKEYCHFFHRPCAECIPGVPDALALTMMYNMEEVQEKCCKWINRNMGKVWPTKAFANLPQEVLEYCVSSAVKDLAVNTVMETMLECQKLNEKTPHLKWTEPIFDMVTRLMDTAIEYSSQHFTGLVSSQAFKDIDKLGMACNMGKLEDIFGMVIKSLSPEKACLAYLELNRWETMFQQWEKSSVLGTPVVPLYSEDFQLYVKALFKRCEDQIKLYIHQAANTAEWDLLTKDMQKNLMEAASYVCIDNTNRVRVAPPKLTSMKKKISSSSSISLKEYFDRHFGRNVPEKTKQKAKPKDKTSKTILKQQDRDSSGERSVKKSQSKGPVKGQLSNMRREKTPDLSKKSITTEKGERTPPLTSAAGLRAAPASRSKPDTLKEKYGTKLKPKTKEAGPKAMDQKTETGRKNMTLKSEEIPKCYDLFGVEGNDLIGAEGRDLIGAEGNDLIGAEGRDLIGAEGNDLIGAEGGEGDIAEEEDYRRRSQSFGTSTFGVGGGSAEIPQIMRTSQSLDSFFFGGQNSTLPRLMPILDVQFIVPHEFYEQF